MPISHVLPCFQLLYDFSQQVGSFPAFKPILESGLETTTMSEKVKVRWAGEGRKIGLRCDAHLCAFALDPYAQAAFTSPEKPECPFLNSEVYAAARRALRHMTQVRASMR